MNKLAWMAAMGALALVLAAPPATAGAESGSQQEAAEQEPTSFEAGCPGYGGSGQRAETRGCGRCGGGSGMHRGKGPGPAGSSRQWGGHRSQMRNAHELIAAHSRFERQVEELSDGVRTLTTTHDPELVQVLRRHVTEMAELIEGGGRIRNWDPLFSTIFDHRDAIRMEIEEIENGVAVTETSDDPAVVALIRAHASKVDAFVARGQQACSESTPLPAEYEHQATPRARGSAAGIPCWTEGP